MTDVDADVDVVVDVDVVDQHPLLLINLSSTNIEELFLEKKENDKRKWK